MRKRRNGYTLAELLIALAIVAVVVAISISTFTGSTKSDSSLMDGIRVDELAPGGGLTWTPVD